MSEPPQQIGLGFGSAGTGINKAFFFFEYLDIGHSAVFIFLQGDAATARHGRDFFKLEDQELAVIADNCNHVSGNTAAKDGCFAFGQIHNLAAVASLSLNVIFINKKDFAGIGRNLILRLGIKNKHFADVVADTQIHHQAQRLPETAPAGNFAGIQVKKLAGRVKQNDFIGGLRMNSRLQSVVVLKLKFFIQGGMAWVAEHHLAAAVSEAGGLGLIGGANAPGEVVREEIRKAKALTKKPFGVYVMLMSPYADDVAKVVVEEGVKVVTTGAGNPA